VSNISLLVSCAWLIRIVLGNYQPSSKNISKADSENVFIENTDSRQDVAHVQALWHKLWF